MRYDGETTLTDAILCFEAIHWEERALHQMMTNHYTCTLTSSISIESIQPICRLLVIAKETKRGRSFHFVLLAMRELQGKVQQSTKACIDRVGFQQQHRLLKVESCSNRGST